MRGVPPRRCDLRPAPARLARDYRPGQLAERVTHGALRRGVLRPGAGHRRGGQRPATGALPRKREWARLTPPPAARVPAPFAARRITPPARSRFSCTSRASSRVPAWAGRPGAPQVRP